MAQFECFRLAGDGTPIYINADHVEELTPGYSAGQTCIVLMDGRVIEVKQTMEQVARVLGTPNP